MGWCHEFGAEIAEGCSHAMVAGSNGCACADCGAVCVGRFAGCARVWARSAPTVASQPPARPQASGAWAAAAARPAGFRHRRAAPVNPPPAGDEETDVETLKEQVRQLTLLTERLAGRLDAVLAAPSRVKTAPPTAPVRSTAPADSDGRPAPPRPPAAEPPAPAAPAVLPSPSARRPAPPRKAASRKTAPTPQSTWPPDALDRLVARTEWKHLTRRLMGKPPPQPSE